MLKQRTVGFLTFALNYKLDGFHERGYHLVNVIIHLLNGLLVYALCLLTLDTPFLRATPISGRKTLVALLCALLFIAHPVQTSAVNYVYQRLALLATMFSLLTFVLYARWRLCSFRPGGPAGGWRPLAWYGGALLALALGMKTKENTFTVPFVIALYELLFFRGPVRKRAINLIPLGMTLFIIPLTQFVSMGRGFGQVSSEYDKMGYNWIHFILTQLRVLVTYIRLLFLPAGLRLEYDYPLFTSFWDAPVILSFAAHCLILGLAGYLIRRSSSRDRELRLIAFGILWFYCFNIMESSILAFVTMIILEYRVYMPSVGFFMAAATGVELLRRKMPSRKAQMAFSALLVLVVVTMSAATYARNEVWRDEARFWEDTVKKSPGRFVPYVNLGAVYKRRGRLAEAALALQSAIRLQPNYADAYVSLGEVYRFQGRPEEARRMLGMALTINPGLAAAHQGMGCLYDDLGRYDEAVREFDTAIRIDPANAQIHDDLGISYARQKRHDEAEREFTAALRLDRDHVNARLHLGMLYDDEGKNSEAIAQLREALRLDRGNAEGHYNLGLAYTHGNRYAEAIQELRRALEINPDHAAARLELLQLTGNAKR
ncbi:MAG TPA: tetratricopeptide repeat protein [Geobacteraceae bacterium]